MRQGEPRTAPEWASVSARFISDADDVLKIGKRQMAYEWYGFGVEAAAKALILRRGVLPRWPASGEPGADQVYTHSIASLIRFAGVFQRLTEDRRRDRRLHDNWLIVKEWFPQRYSTIPPEHKDVARLARASKGVIVWINTQ